MADTPRSTTVRKDVCVIGASAGGVQTLRSVLQRVPPDHPGTVLVVLHLSASGPSMLAEILDRACALPCETARDGVPLPAGRVVVARPNLHLRVVDSMVRLDGGPRENGHRPSVDVLFRTAAAALGPRVLGIVLSGTGDDGTAGLGAIKRQGGFAAVQDPEEAMYTGMPGSAIEHVHVDLVARAEELGDLIAAAAAGVLPTVPLGGGAPDTDALEGALLRVPCPECGGTLADISQEGVTGFACQVGHRFGLAALLDAQRDAVERALWTAARTLEDRGVLLRDVADRVEAEGRHVTARSWRRRADEADRDVRLLRDALDRQAAFDSGLPDLHIDAR